MGREMSDGLPLTADIALKLPALACDVVNYLSVLRANGAPFVAAHA